MAKNSYLVKWLIKGLVADRKYLQPGITVELEPEAAARGLQVGSLELIKAATPGAGTPQGGQAANSQPAVDTREMNKAQLVQYAQEKLGLALDINLSKKNLLAAIDEAAAAAAASE